jgi:hypothetical protein
MRFHICYELQVDALTAGFFYGNRPPVRVLTPQRGFWQQWELKAARCNQPPQMQQLNVELQKICEELFS